uniref:Uncharacterized protein n=2 Tax=Sar TaxID=2698737 RepID=A0A7S2WMC9_9STRA|mmetsp:Transcript_30307/g.48211  ORF Transcript_30307/g.48211 Transcript_30307/m.48211 type:complete len:1011 (-) Transcript_30307:1824-4856(-)|eukprot:CAMPEP_0203744442 /NCGR_PEP_ID=MMETSP0098-20131031/504_1 /ASSEMBLY_ACC=CAM_ASM_000208 /TAXON_ID=96639 /ORGANISM=" , Strain NY0313808BC1" /LENGTH=1010 /DNA_ID=CAMNT_0050631953 /DNA_START=105 /DNA_END=3137 /DNA_ORIENTATION=+
MRFLLFVLCCAASSNAVQGNVDPKKVKAAMQKRKIYFGKPVNRSVYQKLVEENGDDLLAEYVLPTTGEDYVNLKLLPEVRFPSFFHSDHPEPGQGEGQVYSLEGVEKSKRSKMCQASELCRTLHDKVSTFLSLRRQIHFADLQKLVQDTRAMAQRYGTFHDGLKNLATVVKIGIRLLGLIPKIGSILKKGLDVVLRLAKLVFLQPLKALGKIMDRVEQTFVEPFININDLLLEGFFGAPRHMFRLINGLNQYLNMSQVFEGQCAFTALRDIVLPRVPTVFLREVSSFLDSASFNLVIDNLRDLVKALKSDRFQQLKKGMKDMKDKIMVTLEPFSEAVISVKEVFDEFETACIDFGGKSICVSHIIEGINEGLKVFTFFLDAAIDALVDALEPFFTDIIDEIKAIILPKILPQEFLDLLEVNIGLPFDFGNFLQPINGMVKNIKELPRFVIDKLTNAFEPFGVEKILTGIKLPSLQVLGNRMRESIDRVFEGPIGFQKVIEYFFTQKRNVKQDLIDMLKQQRITCEATHKVYMHRLFPAPLKDEIASKCPREAVEMCNKVKFSHPIKLQTFLDQALSDLEEFVGSTETFASKSLRTNIRRLLQSEGEYEFFMPFSVPLLEMILPKLGFLNVNMKTERAGAIELLPKFFFRLAVGKKAGSLSIRIILVSEVELRVTGAVNSQGIADLGEDIFAMSSIPIIWAKKAFSSKKFLIRSNIPLPGAKDNKSVLQAIANTNFVPQIGYQFQQHDAQLTTNFNPNRPDFEMAGFRFREIKTGFGAKVSWLTTSHHPLADKINNAAPSALNLFLPTKDLQRSSQRHGFGMANLRNGALKNLGEKIQAGRGRNDMFSRELGRAFSLGVFYNFNWNLYVSNKIVPELTTRPDPNCPDLGELVGYQYTTLDKALPPVDMGMTKSGIPRCCGRVYRTKFYGGHQNASQAIQITGRFCGKEPKILSTPEYRNNPEKRLEYILDQLVAKPSSVRSSFLGQIRPVYCPLSRDLRLRKGIENYMPCM